MPDTAPVTAVMPTKSRGGPGLRRSIASLGEQRRPPAQAIFIDTTDGEQSYRVERDSDGCSYCGGVSQMLGMLEEKGVNVSVVNLPGSSGAEAKEQGLRLAQHRYVWELSQDAVILTEDWTERAVEALEADDDVVGIGGSTISSTTDRVGSSALPFAQYVTSPFTGGVFVMYPAEFCRGGECDVAGSKTPRMSRVGQRLAQEGRVVGSRELLAAREYPSQKQAAIRNLVISGVVSAATATAVNYAADRLRGGA